MPASADSVKMWRDADGNAHFGDHTPVGASSIIVDTTPENRTGVYGKANQIESNRQRALDQFSERSRLRRTTTREPAGLDYDDRLRIRQLETERNQIRDRMKNKRLSVGDAIVYEEDLQGVNQQIRDIQRKARQPARPGADLDYDDRLRLRQLETQKRQVRDRMKNHRLSVADGIVLEQEIDGINREIREIHAQ
jgi:hypothetical protein